LVVLALAASLAVSVLSLVVLALLWRIGVMEVVPPIALLAMSLLLFTRLCQGWSNGVLAGHKQFGLLNISHLAGSVLQLAVLAPFYWLHDISLSVGLWSFVWGTGLSLAISIVATWNLSKLSEFKPTAIWYRQLLEFSRDTWIANFSSLLVLRLGVFVVGRTAGLAALGLYTLALQILEKTWLISQSFSSVLVPYFSSGRSGVTRQGFYLLCAASLALSLLCAIAVAATGEFLVSWWIGNKFAGIGVILWILTPGMASVAVVRVLASWFLGAGRVHEVRNNTLLSLAILAPLSFGLGHLFGAVGVAVATSAIYTLSLILLWIKYMRSPHSIEDVGAPINADMTAT
jgi:O-antigen/teichoic acid export membrane protein